MRRIFAFSLCVFALCLFVPSANGCGDKLLLIGRNARMRAAIRPAAILAYAQPGSAMAALLQDPQWMAAVKKGQYRVERVDDVSQIGEHLRNTRYDLILGELPEASQLQDAVQSAPFAPLVVPVVDDIKVQRRAAQKQYGCLIRIHAKTGAHLSAIEDALDLKAGADLAKERARRPRKH
jgi:hypothetical protein